MKFVIGRHFKIELNSIHLFNSSYVSVSENSFRLNKLISVTNDVWQAKPLSQCFFKIRKMIIMDKHRIGYRRFTNPTERNVLCVYPKIVLFQQI